MGVVGEGLENLLQPPLLGRASAQEPRSQPPGFPTQLLPSGPPTQVPLCHPLKESCLPQPTAPGPSWPLASSASPALTGRISAQSSHLPGLGYSSHLQVPPPLSKHLVSITATGRNQTAGVPVPGEGGECYGEV